mmetsp:Transcript_36076/g.89979  ORF Transcript_36076/g.89979 Transcript_36076/m.89979 type:complete len:92 (-) Transcript_36076:410-685(-)
MRLDRQTDRRPSEPGSVSRTDTHTHRHMEGWIHVPFCQCSAAEENEVTQLISTRMDGWMDGCVDRQREGGRCVCVCRKEIRYHLVVCAVRQ